MYVNEGQAHVKIRGGVMPSSGDDRCTQVFKRWIELKLKLREGRYLSPVL